jgi:UDP-N-acetylglucosamine--N-acetylmuramyl-(pentapeptide) pyrophosphoryl-undecaprenol N-acetylglucosamine transferase
MDSRIVAFTGGGTGGHIYPGLAVIERLRENFDGRIVWIGSTKESDRATVEAAGVEYFGISSGKLRRDLSLENFADAFRVLAGLASSRSVLAKLRPSILFSKGGYVSVPPCLAASGLGIPVFTHESDLTPGLATRLNARRAERILVSYKKTIELLPEALRSKALLVGNPVRPSIRAGDAARGRALLGVEAGQPIVFFLGGSQGARQVNELVAAVLPELTKRAVVVHQTGPAAAAQAAERTERYKPYAYIRDEMPDILAAADLVVGRSGAGTLWESAALAKPMVLVPLAGAGTRGDQVDNARLFEAAGAARALVGAEATPEALMKAIEAYLGDEAGRRAAGEKARALAGADAAEAAARLILERIGGKR